MSFGAIHALSALFKWHIARHCMTDTADIYSVLALVMDWIKNNTPMIYGELNGLWRVYIGGSFCEKLLIVGSAIQRGLI